MNKEQTLAKHKLDAILALFDAAEALKEAAVQYMYQRAGEGYGHFDKDEEQLQQINIVEIKKRIEQYEKLMEWKV